MSGKQRNIRKRVASEDEDAPDVSAEPECQRDKLAETRLMQQLRKRSAGTGVGALAMGGGGPGIGPASREGSVEPGSEGGEGAGTVVMDAYVKAKSIAVQMDEDAHMQKYVEEQLAARLGKTAEAEAEENDPEVKRRKLEQELYALPSDFTTQLEQELVLPGMVSTLAEVPLAAKDKLKSIEATEALKRSLLAQVGGSTLVLEEDAEARDREAARIRRGQFVKSFGAQKARVHREPEELEAEARKRRFVSERRSAPVGKPRK
ncbi:hypothetical protein CHLRE_10g423350v5 [Chlamydomonas reinhardtii]|uniref:Uncharacterized protein n=1 Tax=Chlamydomonas reinhardtii TaxID=3055 RepID=A8ICG2_CHLRE|nr:uncharacterized protein CHLRE_10g423350v5 [Chlamydomonas reinhardtii]PNW77129.1 hypothetical protein CHLRE_10g423350v5 [Chlamydomonas reinhardtii]|eukprot:XP_001702585.1 predicted protein [Chlamydomonas reinhardtii]